MDRKAVARETLDIMRNGSYEYEGRVIDISRSMKASVEGSRLITPEQGQKLLEQYQDEAANVKPCGNGEKGYHGTDLPEDSGSERISGCRQSDAWKASSGFCTCTVENISTVDAIFKLCQEGKQQIGVLNFASAKNPGGGFINGAMAQEESLAASSTLYRTLTAHEEYYRANRAQSSMMYTDHAIYSPGVLFFRDGQFRLTGNPVEASVLTLPAVNMGQVLQKGEDRQQAERVMRRRMELALAIFASQGTRHLVLGAYGCGVFRNDPAQVAAWWKELLEEGWGRRFASVFHAVLDRSKNQGCIRAFEQVIGGR